MAADNKLLGQFDLMGIPPAPRGVPQPVVDKLSKEIARVHTLAEVIERYANLGVEATGNTPAEFAAYLKTEMAKYAAIAQKARIRAE